MSSRGWRSLQATTIVGAVRRALRRAVVDGGGAEPVVTGPEEDLLRVYEPSRGVVVELPRQALLAPQGPRVELGGWTHPAWLLLPRAAGTSG